MYTHLDCIALRTTRLSDSKSLLSAWSRQHGRLTLAIPAGKTPEARRRRALTAPLCTFEGECNIKPGKDIHSMRDFRATPATLAVCATPLKQITALFLGEVLDLLLRRSEPDAPLSDFLFDAIGNLVEITDQNSLAAFHIIFLYKLTIPLGISPRLEDYHTGAVFDLRDAVFRPSAPLHHDYISGKECTMLMAVSRATFNTAKNLPLTPASRKRALDLILDYYAIHLAPLSALHSLEILREMAQ